MFEGSFGGGWGPLSFGGGAAVPLWDEGDLDLQPALLAYVGIWCPFGLERSFGSLSARHSWYLGDPEISGEEVHLRNWSISLTFYYTF
jgi:hypothetical protein